ncbi:MAG: tyrosine-type recombinase/integrase [Trebonia sp.]
MSPAVSVLHERAEQYVAMRRSLGYKFISQARMLAGFADYLAARGDTTVTVTAALAWATTPDPASAAYHRQRLSVVRGFARHLAAFDPSCQVPPAGLLPPAEVPAPYLYSPREISALIHAAGTLAIPIQAATYHALICLLAVSGMRVGEALALDVADVDLDAGVITVTGKYDHTRLVPLHPTTATMLRDYRQRCDQLFPGPATTGFFLSAAGTRPFRSAVEATFSRLLVRAGITPRHRRPPRIHDLRHSFAVTTLIDWYRTGADVAAMMPLLSRILGHAGPQSTFYYLHAAPELLALAAARLHEHNTGIASTGISRQEAS